MILIMFCPKGVFHSGGVLIGVERGRSSINIYARNRGESEPFCFLSWACFYLAQVLLGLVSKLIGVWSHFKACGQTIFAT